LLIEIHILSSLLLLFVGLIVVSCG